MFKKINNVEYLGTDRVVCYCTCSDGLLLIFVLRAGRLAMVFLDRWPAAACANSHWINLLINSSEKQKSTKNDEHVSPLIRYTSFTKIDVQRRHEFYVEIPYEKKV